MSTAKLTTAVEEYFADLRRIRGAGGATGRAIVLSGSD